MRFGVLGPLLARVGGRDLRFDGPRQAKVLAALLVEANQVVPIPRLVSVMWDREGPATATRQVQDAVSGLRRILTAAGAPQDLISTHRGGYRIGLATAELDLFDFEQQISSAEKYFTAGDAAGAAAALRQAIGLWRSDALADITSTALVARAAQLNGRRIAVHRQCLEIELMLGRHHGIVEELSGLVVAHPFDEGAAELAMLALHRCGRRADALALYRSIRSLFQAELGIEPNPALQQLHQAILTEAGEPFAVQGTGVANSPGVSAGEHLSASEGPAVSAAAIAVPRQLPRDLADFTGRASALEYLCRSSAAEIEIATATGASAAAAVAVVTGAAGVGKSALAVHAGHRVAGAHPDGQLYADLRGTTPEPADPRDILARFLRSLAGDRIGVPSDLDEAAGVFRSLVAGRKVLIVLDDARDSEQVSPLLPATSGCTVYVTSRSRLPGLDCVRRVELDGLDDADAHALVRRIAAAAPAPDDDVEALADIVRSCAGSPLAIRIAGTRLATESGLSPRRLADRLADPGRRLDELTVTDRGIRAGLTIGGSELPDGAVRLLGLLAQWEGSEIGVQASAALVGLPVREWRPVLDVLIDRHLVTSRVPERYSIQELLRLYVAELAAGTPDAERGAAIGRLTEWYLHTVSAANEAIGGVSTPGSSIPDSSIPGSSFQSGHEALAWLDLEHLNLIEAVRGAKAWGHHETAWRLAIGLQGFFLLRSHVADWIATCDIVLSSAAQALPDHARARLLTSLASALIERGDDDRAEQCLRQALALPSLGEDHEVRTAILIALGRAQRSLGHVAEAAETLEQAVASAQLRGNARDEAEALAEKGYALFHAGSSDSAFRCYIDALGLLPATDSRLKGVILGYRGEALLASGDPDAAIECHRQALRVRRAVDDTLLQADSLLAIGDILGATGQIAEACRVWTEAVDLYESIAHPRISDVRERLRSMVLP